MMIFYMMMYKVKQLVNSHFSPFQIVLFQGFLKI